MSSEILEEKVRFNATARGTGRTTRAVESLRAWAEGHPAEKGVMVTHDAQSAATLKRQFFAGVPLTGGRDVKKMQGNELIEWAAETGFDGTHALDKSVITALRTEITRLESLISAPRECPTSPDGKHRIPEGDELFDFCPRCGTPLSAPKEGTYIPDAPGGATGGDADESNAAQLWSTVYLALHRPPSAPQDRCPA